jgi:hypothetical protein
VHQYYAGIGQRAKQLGAGRKSDSEECLLSCRIISDLSLISHLNLVFNQHIRTGSTGKRGITVSGRGIKGWIVHIGKETEKQSGEIDIDARDTRPYASSILFCDQRGRRRLKLRRHRHRPGWQPIRDVRLQWRLRQKRSVWLTAPPKV